MKNAIRLCMGMVLLLIILNPLLFNFNKEDENNTSDELRGDGCLVLSYHRVLPSNLPAKLSYSLLKHYTNDNELELYSVLGDEFEKQMEYLISKGVHFATVEELNSYLKGGKNLPQKSVLITFDDVDLSVYTNAYPILKHRNIPFVLYVISGHAGSKNFNNLKLSTWAQIKEMADSGLADVGSHTHDFHYLGKRKNPPFLDPDNHMKFFEDISLSIKTIEKELGIKTNHFSYPYGFGTPQTDDLVLKAGINLIFTLKPGVTKRDDPSFFIKRFLVTGTNWSSVVKWVEE